MKFAFYVPDTFAPGPETIPSRYSCFQRFNLRQTQADRAIAKPIKLDGSLLTDLIGMMRNGLTLKTVARLATQLLLEMGAPIRRVRRPILQAPVAFDIFRDALTRTEPEFCTFFTNHVAGIMHRYWKYSFPDDFHYQLNGKVDAFHGESLRIALDHADDQIGFLKSYVDRRQGRLYIASSMGQEAIHREQEIEVHIENIERFATAIGFTQPLKSLMAMHPDYSFEFECDADAREFCGLVETLCRADGTPAFYGVKYVGRTARCSTGSGPGFLSADGQALYLSNADGSLHCPFDRCGLNVMERDVGTAYHQPYGTFVRYGAGIRANADRQKIETVRIAPMIMADFGLATGVRHDAPSSRRATTDAIMTLSD